MMCQKILVILLSVQVYATYEDETCIMKGTETVGVCTEVWKCQPAMDDVLKGKGLQICPSNDEVLTVCCVDDMLTPTPGPVATTTPAVPTTTQYVPPVYDYSFASDGGARCKPLSSNLTSPKTGQKAWDKCVEYQELVYPCEVVALNGAKSRGYHCHHKMDGLIVGGNNASIHEFPHMVLLGFGKETDIQWQCGGSLISDRFILTAGHCISDRGETVAFAYIGALRRSNATDSTKLYRIKNHIKHPEYKPPIRYNDIALLEVDRTVKLNQFTVPACLHVGDRVNDTGAVATGWGHMEYRGSMSDKLQKVILTKFMEEECSAAHPANRLMKAGFDAATQMCYGDKIKSKDTCQGDSGGPLQIQSKNFTCMYVVIGVTSFGSACGFVGVPGIYTRVAPYLSWIESVVWP